MTTCPACGRPATTAMAKITLPLGHRRPCARCGSALGLSSSAAFGYFWIALGFVQALRAETLLPGAAWFIAGVALACAWLYTWVPLWHVVGSSTDVSRPDAAVARDERPVHSRQP